MILGTTNRRDRNLHRLSQLIGFALFAIAFRVCVRGPSEPNTGLLAHVVLAIFIAVAFALIFFALRWGCGGGANYWRSQFPPEQAPRIVLLVATALGIQLVASVVFDHLSLLGSTSFATSLLVWTLVPAAFLHFRVVRWPTRLRSASPLTLFVASLLPVVLMTAAGYNNYVKAEEATPWLGSLPATLAGVFVAAAAEEVVFRVLLLTALLQHTGSRFQAVFLSGVLFAATHAPLAVGQPFFRADWGMFEYAVDAYAPLFLTQAIGGLVLGVLWLRTGSITIIAVAHAIINAGSALAPAP